MRDYFISCPFHSNDRTPSLSILLQDRGNLKRGFAHCFACGWTGNYKQVEEKLGHSLALGLGDFSNHLEINDLTGFSNNPSTNSQFKLNTATEENREEYKRDIPFQYSKYLESRGIYRVIQEQNRVYEKGDRVILPFFTPNSKLSGWIERSVSSKFYKVNGNIEYPLGVEETKPSDFVYVTEGQIDAMTLQQAGLKAVSLGSVSNYRLLKHLKNYNICLAFDNDEAGERGRELAREFLESLGKNVYILKFPKEFKDVNEFYQHLMFTRSEILSYTYKL